MNKLRYFPTVIGSPFTGPTEPRVSPNEDLYSGYSLLYPVLLILKEWSVVFHLITISFFIKNYYFRNFPLIRSSSAGWITLKIFTYNIGVSIFSNKVTFLADEFSSPSAYSSAKLLITPPLCLSVCRSLSLSLSHSLLLSTSHKFSTF